MSLVSTSQKTDALRILSVLPFAVPVAAYASIGLPYKISL